MNFEDSYFEDSASDKKECSERKTYEAKICDQEWFLRAIGHDDTPSRDVGSLHDIKFMTLKYKADLLYSRGDFTSAAGLYKQLMGQVPPKNTIVTRELRDCLARSLLKVGDIESAKREAEQLVLPPKDKDCSAWRLLAQCYEHLHNSTGQVMALQKSASLQRSHPDFWISLSEAYGNIKSELLSRANRGCLFCGDTGSSGQRVTDENGGSGDGSSNDSTMCGLGEDTPKSLLHILVTTVQLFRPYFSWRSCCRSAAEDNTVDEIENTSKPAKPDQPDRTAKCTCELRPDLAPLSSTCNQDCPFYGREGCTAGRDYTSTLVRTIEETSLPSPAQQHCHAFLLCLDHSLFTVLVKGLVGPNEVMEMIEELQSQVSPLQTTSKLLSDFFAMSEHSCLLWTKQLLFYAIRHSSSFIKMSLESEFAMVEGRLLACHTTSRKYIEHHFSKRTVFDDSDVDTVDV